MNYQLAYSIGFHPWEDAELELPFVATISELFDQVERDHEAPFGRALDLGTGSGTWGIDLARRGWDVTGVDLVHSALERARARIVRAEVDMKLVHGDVTALTSLGIGDEFALVLDTGTFHGLDDEEREAMGREVTSVTTPDATLLLLVWPKRARPLIRGATLEEVERAFPSWTITRIEPSHLRVPKVLELLLRPDEHWFVLRKL